MWHKSGHCECWFTLYFHRFIWVKCEILTNFILTRCKFTDYMENRIPQKALDSAIFFCEAGIPLPDYLMVWRNGWKIGWKMGQWKRTIRRSYAILESGGVWHVRLDRMDRILLSISINTQNALLDKYNNNHMRSVRQWEQKIGWKLSKH